MTTTRFVEKWVDEAAGLTAPSRVVWCDGSAAEYDRLIEDMLRDGTLLSLNPRTYPNCYLHRSHPSDVARTEQLTFICTRTRDDAGPTNNWMEPAEAKERVGGLFRKSMHGRTMYVIPYLMGPAGSPMSRVGVMVTDSAYVVASMHIMARVGQVALQHMRHPEDFVAGMHSLGDLSPDRRFIMHFPEERLIWSVGSGYGGNALLGKKCHALRIASSQARQEGWMAEHMLILGLEDPDGAGDLPRGGHAERLGQDESRDGRLEAARAIACGRWETTSPGSTSTPRGSSARSTPSAASSAWRPIPARRPIRTASPPSAPTPSSPTSR